jgi:hypothetical protein
MHFLTLVISDEKPTEELLKKWLSPFVPEKLDFYALGGRYTGLFIPREIENTVTGGPDVPEAELALAAMSEEIGVKSERPGFCGSGVDALQVKNFDGAGAGPMAVVKDGKWFEPSEDAKAAAAMNTLKRGFRKYPGFESVKADEKGQKDLDEWNKRTFIDLVADVRPDQWLSYVDCHH